MATIDTFYPNQYATNFEAALRQMGSLIRGAATDSSFAGEVKAFNLLNTRGVNTISSRLQATPSDEPSFEKVWMAHSKYDIVSLYDEFDDTFLAQLALPTSEDMKQHLDAMMVKLDQTIINAILGNRITGENFGDTTTALPGSQKVAIDYVESGAATSSGLTIGKIRAAKQKMDAAFVPKQNRYLLIGSAQANDLLRTIETTSRDFAPTYNASTGEFSPIFGFKIIETEYLPEANDVRSVVAFQKDSVKFSIGKITAHMDVREDLRHALQLRSVAAMGATRFQTGGCVEIACGE